MKKIVALFLFSLLAFGLAQAAKLTQLEQNTRMQIFLFQENFSPGKIDGTKGKFTEQALKYYQMAHPQDMDAIDKSLEQISPIFITYTIRKEDKDYIGKVPKKRSEQAKNKYMPYSSFAEFIAERFHTDLVFLKKLNPKKNLNKLQVGDELIVPNVAPFMIEDISEKKLSKQSKFSKRSIKINTKGRMLLLYEGDKLLAVFPITPGSSSLPAPQGTWKIESITYLPWFRYDEKMLQEGTRGTKYYNIPPGPGSPVGVVWIALNKRGIGIHGTDKPETIGRSESHGCIRLSNWDAVTLSKMITKNIKVQID
jgi:lipoprotein-anchoring transpeptidase ErfK/SrfK